MGLRWTKDRMKVSVQCIEITAYKEKNMRNLLLEIKSNTLFNISEVAPILSFKKNTKCCCGILLNMDLVKLCDVFLHIHIIIVIV